MIKKETVKTYLRLDDADDDWLDLVIPQVEDAVENWVGGEDKIQNDKGDMLESAKLAIITEIGRVYLEREGPETKGMTNEWYTRGYSLGPGATALLTPLRKPTVA